MYNQELKADITNFEINYSTLEFEGKVDDQVNPPFWSIYDESNDKYYLYESEHEYISDMQELKPLDN